MPQPRISKLRRLADALEHSADHDKPEDKRRVMFNVARALMQPGDFKIGMTVVANASGLGWSYRAEIEDIYNGRALLLPLEVPFTASSVRTKNYKKRRRWVRLDRLQEQ